MNRVKADTGAADIPSPCNILLPELRTAAGDPIRVRFQEARRGGPRARAPHFPGRSRNRTWRAEKVALEARKDHARRQKAIRDWTMACAVIVAGCVEPRFCMGLDPIDGRRRWRRSATRTPVGTLRSDHAALGHAPGRQKARTKERGSGRNCRCPGRLSW